MIEKFLLEVDRLKSLGRLSDYDILMIAFDRVSICLKEKDGRTSPSDTYPAIPDHYHHR